MKIERLLRILVLALLLGGSRADGGTVSWLHFDELGEGTWVSDDFEEQGVHFVSDFAEGRAYQSAPRITEYALARTSPNVLVNQASDNEIFSSRNVPLVFWFDDAISGVGMQLGCVGPCGPGVVATVRLYDCEGDLVASDTIVPRTDFQAPLQVLDPTGTTRRVEVDYGDTSTLEAIDELAIESSETSCRNPLRPSISITSHSNNQFLIDRDILIRGEVSHPSGIVRRVMVNGESAGLTPSSGAGAYGFSAPVTLREGYNSVTALAFGPDGSKASASINLSIGEPTSVELTDFHLTQRGIMRTNVVCDIDTPLVAGKFTIARAQFEARTSTGVDSYVDSVLMSLWRRNGGTQELVERSWGELYSPQTVNFSSASDLSAVHFWIPGEWVDLAGEYSLTFQPYVGANPIGAPLDMPCDELWLTFSETRPIRLLILPVEGQLFDSNWLPSDHDNVFEQLEAMARLYPIREGYSSLWNSEATGVKWHYSIPHVVCDGLTTSSFCKGTGFEWRFKDTHPTGLWKPSHEAVVDPTITTCRGDSIIGGLLTGLNLTNNLPRPTQFGLFTPGTPSEWEGRRYAWPLDDDHDGEITDDFPNYIGEFFDEQTGQWSTDLADFDIGETFRSYVDSNGDYCHDKESEAKLPMHKKYDHVRNLLLWAPAGKTLKHYNAYVRKLTNGQRFQADRAVLWLPNSFHPMRTDFHQFDPGSGQLGGRLSWVSPGDLPILAHEVGHNFGLNHANSFERPWQAYVRRERVHSPDRVYSAMRSWSGPIDEAFFRNQDYRAIFDDLVIESSSLSRLKAPLQAFERPMISIDIVLDTSGEVAFFDYLREDSLEATPVDPTSPLRLRFGRGNEVLQDLGVPFQLVARETWSRAESASTAHLTTLWPEAAEWIEVAAPVGDPERYFVSRRPPTVELVSPNGGESFFEQDLLEIQWEANDPDGDALTFTLFYSPEGNRWHPIATGLTETQYMLEVSSLPGGDEAKVRVIASDGFHQTESENANPFAVEGRAPIISIRTPSAGSQYLEWDTIVAEGAALDAEDGPMEASWFLNGSGRPLGSGMRIEMPHLAPGERRLVWRVVDSDGFEVTDETTFEVIADSDRDGMSDTYEEDHGLVASLARDASLDADGDGLSNFEESWRGSAASRVDTDGDGIDDGVEATAGSDPLDASSIPDNGAARFFVETFDDSGIGESLEDPSGAFLVAGGALEPVGARDYVRTVLGGYINADFVAELRYRIAGAGAAGGLFFGIGSGEPDPAYFNEPLHSVYALDFTQDFLFFQGSLIRATPEPGGPLDLYTWADPNTLSDGEHALRLTKEGDLLVWEMDHDYDDNVGFQSSYINTMTLDQAPFLDVSNSHLFFGGEASPTRFLELSVRPLIEPRLTATLRNQEIRLSWIVDAGPNWRLQTAESLDEPVQWETISGPFADDGQRFRWVEYAGRSTRFYRLRQF